ncbi:uncharacterized protein LOC132065616 [Lycium ferocissimum]|uniref:uncharacterized protein LOC132065616 n=1 Tax=Lycium ferocissimum TaxID=112874 RepID=UPI002815EC38|nr:uncharacterized protein LOC132065616 [Lycium ferocissimum]XP_059315075.1 uncharacterized protein LOC132065616 [Lycium ferocissimum]XP_059315076.1 uncharacterized protein LOC132065616 [Lycium ferocissimum]
MGRPGLRNWDIFYEARRGNKKAETVSDNIRFVQKISSSDNVDEDYFEFLKHLYNYDIDSQSYTNEYGNDGSYYEVEVEYEDEDEADPQYKMFLANAKPDGKSYVLNTETEDGLPVSIKYEKECGCDDERVCACWKKKKDIEMRKDEKNSHPTRRKVEVKKRRMSTARSMGDVDVIFEPSDPTSQRKNGTMRRKISTGKHGPSKRQRKSETKIKSGKEKMIEKGSKLVHVTGKEAASDGQGKSETKIKSDEEKMIGKGKKPVHVTGKEEASDVAEEYVLLLENLQNENWSMKTSLRSGCNIEYEAVEDDLEILYDNSDTLEKSKFRQKVMDLLKKPYNTEEYKELWTYVNDKKPVERNMETRRGGLSSYKTTKMGKSYLELYEDLKEKLKEFDNDESKKLKIMRGFTFWLQNVVHGGAFKPWNDREFLALVAEST